MYYHLVLPLQPPLFGPGLLDLLRRLPLAGLSTRSLYNIVSLAVCLARLAQPAGGWFVGLAKAGLSCTAAQPDLALGSPFAPPLPLRRWHRTDVLLPFTPKRQSPVGKSTSPCTSFGAALSLAGEADRAELRRDRPSSYDPFSSICSCREQGWTGDWNERSARQKRSVGLRYMEITLGNSDGRWRRAALGAASAVVAVSGSGGGGGLASARLLRLALSRALFLRL